MGIRNASTAGAEGTLDLERLGRSCPTHTKRMQASRTRAQQELGRSKGNLASTLEAITRLENGLADASTKFGFLQEIRAYVADLCDMLQVSTQAKEALGL